MANDFLPFGIGAGANVLAQSDYVALAARVAGFSSGTAKSIELNKVWRQSSVISSVLAQMIADRTGLDVLDDGNTDTLKTNLVAAVADIASQGVTAITGLTNANVTLTASQAAKPIISLSGTLTGNVQVIFPTYKQSWLVVNNSTGIFTVTCKTASGAGVVVPSGNSVLIFGDGTSILTSTGIQASETQQGTAKIATQGSVNTGTEDTTVVTPKKLRFGVSMSLGVNGYLALPSWLGGVIIQWGRGSVSMNIATGALYYTGASSVSFPLTFPNAVWAAMPAIQNTPNAMDSIGVSSITTSVLSVVGCTSNENPQGPTFYYIAIGN